MTDDEILYRFIVLLVSRNDMRKVFKSVIDLTSAIADMPEHEDIVSRIQAMADAEQHRRAHNREG